MRFAPLLKLTLCTLTVLTLAGLTGCAPLQRTDPYAKVPQAGFTGAEPPPIRAKKEKTEKKDLQAPLTLDRAIQ